MSVVDIARAFVPHGRMRVEGRAGGPLAGLTFAAKDLYDVAGHPTGAGNPTWLATHSVPERSAPLVERLIAAGATLIGKTITDELAYSINGDNVHYGTPVNVNAPGRVPGGSSSGSAAAVAAGACDFALGTDTGGSVRVPASFCGVWGIRPTHGILPADGVVPLMPSYDTFGWLARERGVFARVSEVLAPAKEIAWSRVVILDDACEEADAEALEMVSAVGAVLQGLVAASDRARIADDGLEAWRAAYVTASAHEGWRVHGAWIEAERPAFGAAIAQRFAYAKSVSDADAANARRKRERIRTRVRDLLGASTIAVLPTAAGPAPRIDDEPRLVDAFRMRTLRLTSIAGHAGVPQVSIPLRLASGLPLGVSLMGPAQSDRALVGLAVRVAGELRVR